MPRNQTAQQIDRIYALNLPKLPWINGRQHTTPRTFKALLVAFCHHEDQAVTHRMIGRHTGMDEKTVMHSVKIMEQEGWIERTQESNTPSDGYRVTINWDALDEYKETQK